MWFDFKSSILDEFVSLIKRYFERVCIIYQKHSKKGRKIVYKNT